MQLFCQLGTTVKFAELRAGEVEEAQSEFDTVGQGFPPTHWTCRAFVASEGYDLWYVLHHISNILYLLELDSGLPQNEAASTKLPHANFVIGMVPEETEQHSAQPPYPPSSTLNYPSAKILVGPGKNFIRFTSSLHL